MCLELFSMISFVDLLIFLPSNLAFKCELYIHILCT